MPRARIQINYIHNHYTNEFYSFSQITSMAIDTTNKYQYVCSENGRITKTSIVDEKVDKDFGKIGKDETHAMVLAKNDRFLFVASNIYMKVISAINGNLIKDFQEIHCTMIKSIVLTENNKYQFSSDSSGVLKQWCTRKMGLVKDHEIICDDLSVLSMTI